MSHYDQEDRYHENIDNPYLKQINKRSIKQKALAEQYLLQIEAELKPLHADIMEAKAYRATCDPSEYADVDAYIAERLPRFEELRSAHKDILTDYTQAIEFRDLSKLADEYAQDQVTRARMEGYQELMNTLDIDPLEEESA